MNLNQGTIDGNTTNNSLIQHGDHIRDIIQAGVDISNVSKTMKNFIDEANKQLNNDWQGELNFNVFTEDNHSMVLVSRDYPKTYMKQHFHVVM